MSYKMTEGSIYQSLLHTPEGVRDIYGIECEEKLRIQNTMHQILKSYGFRDIQTPMFEFFDIFNKERGTVASREMYKFFDREGNTLVLRPDMTPSIARCVAKYCKEEEFPIRLCYVGNTFINDSDSYRGRLKEMTQIGAELINDDSSDADAEMLALTIECLKNCGLEEFQVEVGHAKFVEGLLNEADFDEEEAVSFRMLLESKNRFGMEDLVESKNLSGDLKELILKLPELFGSIENIQYAKEKVKNSVSLKALERLLKLYTILKNYGLSDYVTFDLGMFSKYDYYTGIIFRAYTYGNGEAVMKGGRYDNLLKQFGKKSTAIGFAIEIDQLMMALSRQKKLSDVREPITLLLYEASHQRQAIEMANVLRKSGKNIQLVRKSSAKNLELYKKYALRQQMAEMIYLHNGTKEEVNL